MSPRRANARTRTARTRDDREKLELFIRRVADLASNTLAQEGLRIQVNFIFAPEGSTVHVEQPPEEAVRLMLTDFRQLISQDEDVSLYRINGICERRLNDDAIKQQLRAGRATWRHLLGLEVHTLNVAGRTRNPEQIADLWLNGRYFHNDVTLQDELDAMNRMQQWLLWTLFTKYIFFTGQYLNFMATVIAKGLDDGAFTF